ncbi:MAG TPA: alpha/beta hydrolase [Candidatus Limnocylindrales bacterium]|nr:alpha/beta hydrolase [Candidatus Limnocylindrales bacterium]
MTAASGPGSLPAPIRATDADLPASVAAALASPEEPARLVVDAAGIPYAVAAWGRPADPPLLLVHGVTASSGIWWRVGPALAAAGLRVLAIDQPGHGRTGHWTGHHRFRDNARDLAAFVGAAGLVPDALSIVGHSWGAMTVAALPAVGLRPRRMVLLDPPAAPHAVMAAMVGSTTDRSYEDLAEAILAVGSENPRWSFEDVRQKADALVHVDPVAARAILLENGDWDGGLADLTDPAAAGIEAWLVRGDPDAGGLVPDEALPALAAAVGPDHVLTIAGGAHAPQRLLPEATTLALLRALGADAGRSRG